MAEDARSWTEKHRPKTLDEVLGNPSAVDKLRAWADTWSEGRPDKPGVLLAGEPGLGKTSAALALAEDMGWSTIELNASDVRTKDAIERIATRGAVSQGFSSTGEYQSTAEAGRKLIILDEADNVFGREDRGGMQQIARTLDQTQQPVVLIANDEYELSSTVKRNCKQIDFDSVRSTTIANVLGGICRKEGVEAEAGALEALAEHANGDVRAAVSDLESIARGRGQVRIEDVERLGYRDTTATIFDALEDILQADEFTSARQASFDLDEDPETLLLWIEENLPREYDDPHDRAAGMAMVGRADEFLGATQRTRYYRLWSYATDLMTGGVATAKTNRYSGWTRYQFPSWLRKMGRSKQQRKLRDGFGGKVGEAFHTGTNTAREHVIPALQFIAERHREMAVQLTARLELSDDELGLLLEDATSSQIDAILEQAEAWAQEQGRPKRKEVTIDVPDTGDGSEPEESAEDDEEEAASGEREEAAEADEGTDSPRSGPAGDEDEEDPEDADDGQTGLMDF